MEEHTLRSDTRAVSPVIGAVLMLALAMLVVTTVQAMAIPQLNAQAEFEHNQGTQTDMVGLETTVDRVAATGTGETAPVNVGFRYPTRLFFVNPPPATGTIRTTEPRQVTVSNAEAPGETGDYWDGSPRTFPTRTAVYDPAYNEYRDAPTTVYEPWAVYNRQDAGTVALTATDLVDDRRLSLVALDGTYARSSAGTVGVNAEPVSAPVRTVTVRNDTAPITLTVPTGLRNDTWLGLLEDELDGNGGAITGVDCAAEPPSPCGELTLTLEPGTYELRFGKVGLGSRSSDEPARYLTDVEGNATAVPEGGRQRLVVEARDRFDNPVSGVPVAATLDGDPGSLEAVTPVTRNDGRATFLYTPPADVAASRPVTVTASFGSGDAQRTVTFDIRVVDLDGSGGPPGNSTGGPGSAATAVEPVEGTVGEGNVPGSGREATFDIRASREVTITGFSVETRDDLAGRSFTDSGTTFDGRSPPVSFADRIPVALREFAGNSALGVSRFVDPADPEADIVVALEFSDGSTKTLALA